MKNNCIKKVLTAVFMLSWFAIFLIAGSLEQYIIDFGQAVVSFVIVFAAIGVSGFLSGMLTLPDKFDRKKYDKN